MRDAEAGNEWGILQMKKAPKLEGGTKLYWSAFTELSSMRGGMGDGMIPLDKIHWYADDILELDWREKEAFSYIIHGADIHSINTRAAKNANKSK